MTQKNTTQKTWPHNFDVLKAQIEINKLSPSKKIETSEIFARIWSCLTKGEKLTMGKKIERSSERRTIEKNITSFLPYKRI